MNLMAVIDRTLSMKDTFHPFADFMVKYSMRKALEEDPLETVGLVLFDDHPTPSGFRNTDVPILEVYYPTDNLEEFAYWLYTAEAGSGMDIAEAISCAYQKAVEISIPDTSIWIVTDAIPHGMKAPPGMNYEVWDSYLDGCPCGCPLPPQNSKILLVKSGLTESMGDIWKCNDYTNIVILDQFIQETEEALNE